MRQTAEWLLAQFPDLHMTVEAMVAEGDTVAVRILSEGTNLGPLNGVVPPTGKRFSARQSHWFRVEDGKLVEHWATREDLPTMLQLGIIQLPGGPPSQEECTLRAHGGRVDPVASSPLFLALIHPRSAWYPNSPTFACSIL
jgi:hypothetical protein